MLSRTADHSTLRYAVAAVPEDGARSASAQRGACADGRDGESVLGVIPLDGDRRMLVVGRIIDADGAAPAAEGPAAADALVVDRDTRRVWAHGRRVELTYQEFELLARLTGAPRRVFTRVELLELVWETFGGVQSRTVDVHIHRLRRKLGPLGRRLCTVRRVGYAYRPDEP